MLYGAYGTTGRRILNEALSRGHRPILAGRDGAQLAALGKATGLDTLAVALEDGPALRAALSSVAVVLHAAGPFQLTGPLMRAACLDAGCSYLDVNGEIGDFGAALACDAKARETGVGIIPGVGYGVVFAECVAVHLAARLPEADWLRLSLATQNEGSSRGAQMSAAAVITAGGRDIFRGKLRRQALAHSNWRTPGTETLETRFSSAPLAELLAAQRSTGIPTIVTGIPLPRTTATLLRISGPLLGRLMTWQARRASKVSQPSSRSASTVAPRSRVWAEVGTAAGAYAAAVLETGEGYHAAAAAAVRALELQLLQPRIGALTPVQAFGADFALLVPGTTIRDL